MSYTYNIEKIKNIVSDKYFMKLLKDKDEYLKESQVIDYLNAVSTAILYDCELINHAFGTDGWRLFFNKIEKKFTFKHVEYNSWESRYSMCFTIDNFIVMRAGEYIGVSKNIRETKQLSLINKYMIEQIINGDGLFKEMPPLFSARPSEKIHFKR